MQTGPADVFDALTDEYAAIATLLGTLDEPAWAAPSLCEGWSVADVVLHLAQSEEAVLASIGTTAGGSGGFPEAEPGATVDDLVETWVASERGASPSTLFERWRAASTASSVAMRQADPADTFRWATIPLRPRTLATTRLSEHWIHANDIAQPLGVDHPDTDRLWHIARLAHRTIPYAYARAGRDDAPTVRVELTGPSGDRWTFGDDDADVSITGRAAEFCRIAARRLDPGDAPSIEASGDRADEVLTLVRTYA